MFRRRIYAQFFTIAAIVAGSAYWSQDRSKRAEFEKVEKERLAVERRERWLAELDARDREDREIREQLRESRERRLAPGVTDEGMPTVPKGKRVGRIEPDRKPRVVEALESERSGDEGEKKGGMWSGFWSKKE